MPNVVAYHRPTSIEAAVALLAESGRVALGGGSTLPARTEPVEVVDLQALDLAGIDASGPLVTFGAMTRLQDVVDSDLAPELLRRQARAEEPSTLRTLATLGGLIASAHAESVLLAGLLVHDARVTFADGSTQPLPEVLGGARSGALITAVSVTAGGRAAQASTARTPADTPIVAAVARRTDDGTIRLALTGVAATPILVDPADPTAGLVPPPDFRGSAGYRLHLSATLAARVLGEVSA